MESLARLPCRNNWQVHVEQRQRKKDALRDWLSSQPNEVLVESLMRGVLSPSTLAEIVKAARKAYDEEHGNKPNYKNLQVDGNVDGVKIGVNGLRVFTSDGRKAGKVIGFEPAPPPPAPRVSPRLASNNAGGSPGPSSAVAVVAAIASPQTEPSVKSQGKRPAKAARSATPGPKVTPGAFVVQWASKPACARNIYDGTTELLNLEALKQLTWHRLGPSAKAAEGDWRRAVFECFLEDVQRRARHESERPVWLWLHLSPPVYAALEQLARLASVVDYNIVRAMRWDHQGGIYSTGCLKLLPETNEIEISMTGHRTVVPAPALMHRRQHALPGASAHPSEAEPVLAFSILNLLTDVCTSGVRDKAGLVGSFLQIRAETATAPSSIQEAACVHARTTLIHVYLPPLLPFYVWVLQRKGLDPDTVQHVVRFLLLRREVMLDAAHKQTAITRHARATLAPTQPAVAIALSATQVKTIVKHLELFSTHKGSAASHRAVRLTVLLRWGAVHGLPGKASLSLVFSGNSGVDCDDHDPTRVTKTRVVWKSIESDAITWPKELDYRALQATFNVSDGHDLTEPFGSSLVDALLHAAPQAHATLRLCPPVVGNHLMDGEDGLLSLQLSLPKGGHLAVDAPLVLWVADPPSAIDH